MLELSSYVTYVAGEFMLGEQTVYVWLHPVNTTVGFLNMTFTFMANEFAAQSHVPEILVHGQFWRVETEILPSDAPRRSGELVMVRVRAWTTGRSVGDEHLMIGESYLDSGSSVLAGTEMPYANYGPHHRICKRNVLLQYARCELNETLHPDFGIEYFVLFVPIKTTLGELNPVFELRAKWFTTRVITVPGITVIGLIFPEPEGHAVEALPWN